MVVYGGEVHVVRWRVSVGEIGGLCSRKEQASMILQTKLLLKLLVETVVKPGLRHTPNSNTYIYCI